MQWPHRAAFDTVYRITISLTQTPDSLAKHSYLLMNGQESGVCAQCLFVFPVISDSPSSLLTF